MKKRLSVCLAILYGGAIGLNITKPLDTLVVSQYAWSSTFGERLSKYQADPMTLYG